MEGLGLFLVYLAHELVWRVCPWNFVVMLHHGECVMTTHERPHCQASSRDKLMESWTLRAGEAQERTGGEWMDLLPRRWEDLVAAAWTGFWGGLC